ncbi:MAG: hypothetical protein MHMPM18_002295 [Marteilia pararefringens]
MHYSAASCTRISRRTSLLQIPATNAAPKTSANEWFATNSAKWLRLRSSNQCEEKQLALWSQNSITVLIAFRASSDLILSSMIS